jgi:hypothetical protein
LPLSAPVNVVDVEVGAVDAAAATIEVAAETAVELPAVLEAVTAMRRVEPTSTDVRAYELLDADAIELHAPPEVSQRCHW